MSFTTNTESNKASGTNRRQLLTRAGIVGAAALGTGLLKIGKGNEVEAAEPITYMMGTKKFGVNDFDILNFALNAEYLGAEYYSRAVTGMGLGSADTGLTTSNVSGGSQVTFTSTSVQQLATEFAADELGHVRALRTALGKHAVAEPAINFTAAFTSLAVAAGVIPSGGTFDPFSSQTNFILGAFILEDVDVTAYIGAAPYVKNPAYLNSAAGILAVEAYHAAAVRTLVYQAGSAATTIAGQISALRNAASNAADSANLNADQNVVNSDGTANIVPADGNSLAFARTFAQVLNIVYGSTAAVTRTMAPVPGGFFPNGFNGRIR